MSSKSNPKRTIATRKTHRIGRATPERGAACSSGIGTPIE